MTRFVLTFVSLTLVATCDDAPDPDMPSMCCPIEEATCDCFGIGGSRSDGCPAICDAEPDGWVETVDDNGCPVLEFVGGSGSCLPLPDAGVDDAGAGDASP